MNSERLAKLMKMAQSYAHDIKMDFTPEGAERLAQLLSVDYDSLSDKDKDTVDCLSVVAIVNAFNEAVCEDTEPVSFNPSLN